jgi:hypothetical protein
MKLKAKGALIVLLLSLVILAVLLATEFSSLAAGPMTATEQRTRMFLFFAAYLALLMAVRAMLKSRQQESSRMGAKKLIIVAIASVGIGGVAFIVIVVLAFMLNGAEALGSVMGQIFFLVPAITIAAVPFVLKYLKL